MLRRNVLWEVGLFLFRSIDLALGWGEDVFSDSVTLLCMYIISEMNIIRR